MKVTETDLEQVLMISPRQFRDNRGYFVETYNRRINMDLGINIDFVQDNQSISLKAGTVRGLHYQSPPYAQAKLIRVSKGAITDVAVDIRNGSPDYGKWISVKLTADEGNQLFIPAGFLHGFVTLTDNCCVQYKCSDYYAPQNEGSVRFDDDDLNIDWGIKPDTFIVSDKDLNAEGFSSFESPFNYKESR